MQYAAGQAADTTPYQTGNLGIANQLTLLGMFFIWTGNSLPIDERNIAYADIEYCSYLHAV
ncbi:uncharacterized protein RAG0_11122 [Rhynchosporium agropyri]|uniref:Uncharacterized protein n=1 Tax=Rhynchosporium agropyri TaxID=914238 RepID=A0A1E1L2Q4_9HELO|nr:uncharacterized protein RAG0_11122 [Rhynchosporium agropyri]